MIKNILHNLTHPVVLAIPFTIIVILVLPPFFNKYTIEIKDKRAVGWNDAYSYFDLDNNGINEEIYYHGTLSNIPTFFVKSDNKIIDQWKFKGKYLQSNYFTYCDFDHDSLTEIFVCLLRNDSILLEGISPFEPENDWFIDIFVDSCNLYNDNLDCGITYSNHYDSNSDGYDELVFSIETGYSKQPRNFYLIDIKNGKVIKSPTSGTALCDPFAYDIDNDGLPEFFGVSRASGNFSEKEINYTDMKSWLMILDDNMDFLFEPIPYGTHPNVLDYKPWKIGESIYILALQIHTGEQNIADKLIKLDLSGNELSYCELPKLKDFDFSYLTFLDVNTIEDPVLMYGSEIAYLINDDLSLREMAKLTDKIYSSKHLDIDVDVDGTKEKVYVKNDLSGIVIMEKDFKNPTLLETKLENPISPDCFSVTSIPDSESTLLYFQIRGEYGIYTVFSPNPYFRLKYLVWLVIYFILLLILFFLQQIQNIRAKAKYNTEQKISELQLIAIKNQIDPHFTLNLIDSIGNLFYKNDKDKASYIFDKYAMLLRNTIISSQSISTSLSSEIEYVRNYLELEMFRHDNKFKYLISLDENAFGNVLIPKMLIHTFVENSIKHGLKHKENEDGDVSIRGDINNNVLVITIKDNGIGRTESKKYNTFSTGQGIRIINDMLMLYAKMTNFKITYTIIDLIDSASNSLGTEVRIFIPYMKK